MSFTIFMNESIFKKQNIIYKFTLISLGIFYAFVLKPDIIFLLIILNILILLIDSKLLISWLDTLKKLSFFILSYLVFSTIFDIDFLTQVGFLLKLGYLLQLSVFFTKSSSINCIMYDLRYFRNNSIFNQTLYFLLALNYSLYMFSDLWNKEIKKHKEQGFKWNNMIYIFENIINAGAEKASTLKVLINKAIRKDIEPQDSFFSMANLLLTYQITAYVLIASL